MSSYLVGRDGHRYPIDEPRWRGDDGSPLLVGPLDGIGPDGIDYSIRSQWRYAAALPLDLAPVSLGEGCTPLLETTLGGTPLLVKPEWFNPTGSFKDRGTAVMMAMLAAQGIDHILEDSSGNGGASVAAYAAAAGIRATILAPESTSPAKLIQSRAHGATVDLVAGSRQATADEAIRRSGDIFYASHNWHPFFVQGVSLLAYEMWEDLGFEAPDAVILPAGAGSLVLGCSIGFGQLLRAGMIERMPRLLVVQPENCSPLVRAFAAGEHAVRQADWSPTLAEGTSIARPVRDREVLAAIRESQGCLVAVAEASIIPSVRELASRGLYAEPTSAIVAAAVPEFVARGAIRPGDSVVAVLTGSGLKATGALQKLLA
ncbi:pyridoxal-phosphate dependent enzyme [Salinibacterium hongtaonis]|uniref:pyridoxal-phosphate dependent enzyme n=1 Tax=Homoserinimonas hongtaonis TaxID=2079791 RepID=UPI000D3B143B|nr:pyridoxal-phosphate dependent enzyme [Salinibacterium hongtaonis]AWB88858.1 pyridoxal-5'-phosphate-dependent protein subunit beta [Salinibacterium hongtaonis]